MLNHTEIVRNQNCCSRKPDKLANLFPKGKGNGLRAKNDKGSDKIWGSENECTTQGLERFLREILELPEVPVKAITGNIFFQE